MQSKELRAKTVIELETALKDLTKQLREKSMSVIAGKLKNIKLPRLVRKDIARVKGVLVEKQILTEVSMDKKI